jgi:uncharacterized protein YwqG|tara:strand:- start:481 stop:972 length:492 start_codon:yes stop_codon:yes gene_type:complete
MKVVDNFLEKEDFLKIQQIMLSKDFPWFFQHGVNELDTDKDIYDCQFTHVFFMENSSRSHMLEMLQPLIAQLKISAIIKIKANLLTRTPKIIKHGFHIDHTPLKDAKTAVFYLNTNNGYTLFKNDKKVMSVENRAVLFNLNTPHSGTTSSDSKRRVVLNFNYI